MLSQKSCAVGRMTISSISTSAGCSIPDGCHHTDASKVGRKLRRVGASDTADIIIFLCGKTSLAAVNGLSRGCTQTEMMEDEK
jgi:hypothetical protein